LRLLPLAIRFGAAAAVLHLLVFFLLIAGIARGPVLAIAGISAAAILLYGAPRRFQRPALAWWVAGIIGTFGIVYIVNALAPEIQADANAYHLTAAIEASRTGAFPDEIAFYDRLPHATELLFVFAYAFGGVPAAKLTHLAFLLFALPLIVAIGRGFALPDPLPAIAAAIYFVTPVAGVSGSSAFNDAALVFYTLASVWAALKLRESPSVRMAVLLGVFAGMCYAVKMNGGITAIAAGAFLIGTRRWRAILPFSAGAAIVILPWLLRNLVETGNPVAPFYNALFPNEYFYIAPEQQLTRALRSYGVMFSRRFTEVTAGWRLQGAIGPAFLLTPLALIALRRPSGRALWLLAVVFSAGWWMNAGSRFLLPALPFIALAIVSAFPKPLAVGFLLVHALLSWPWVIAVYSPEVWKITGFPWRAALHAESPDVYLTRTSWEYRLARMVEQNTPATARIFDLAGLHRAHLGRRLLGPWQSAEGYRLFSALDFARVDRVNALDEWRATFDARPAIQVRIRQQSRTAPNWSLNEILLMYKGARLKNRNRWRIGASANPWDARFAFDRNGVSRWSTWRRANPADYFAIDLAGPETLDEIRVTSPVFEAEAVPAIDLMTADGAWTSLSVKRGTATAIRRRLEAMRLLKRSRITHIVIPAAHEGIGILGYSFANEAEDWGLDVVTNFDAVYLLRVR
jgi:hypothetical protein